MRFALPLLLSLIVLPHNAQADYFLQADDFDFHVGGAVVYEPEFLGGSDYKIGFRPDAEVTYKNTVYLSARHGLGINIFNDIGTRMGVGVAPNFGRDEGASDHLTGLGDVDFGFDMNAFVHGYIDPFIVGLDARREFADGDNGAVLTGFFGFREPVTEDLTWSGRTSLSWTNADWSQAYFGVDSAQSIASGLAVYTPGEGLRDASLSTSLTYALSPSLSLASTVGYTRLLGDVADSPVAQNQNQFLFMLGLKYEWVDKKVKRPAGWPDAPNVTATEP